MKTNVCIGCGDTIDYELDKNLCKRCFKMKYYNENVKTKKSNEDYLKIINKIKKQDLVLYVVDIFNLNFNIEDIFNELSENIILVLTKKDIIPKSVKEEKILSYFSDKFLDKVFISSNKNYNLDRLFNLIKKHKKTENVYVVGKTNSGKSTLINKIIKNYTESTDEITTSYYPSTTLADIKIKIKDNFYLIDTPGIIDNTDIINYISDKEIKKIIPRKEIKPTTFQIEKDTSIILDNYMRIDVFGETSLTFYHSTFLEPRINSMKNDKNLNLVRHELEVFDNEDIVINGLLFIKATKKCDVILYTLENVDVYLRRNLI